MKLIIKNNYDDMCAWAANHIADAIQQVLPLLAFIKDSLR